MKRLQELLKQPVRKDEVLSRNAVLIQKRLQDLYRAAEDAAEAGAEDEGQKMDAFYDELAKLQTVVADHDDVDELVKGFTKVLLRLGYDVFEDPSTAGSDEFGFVIVKR